MYGDTRYVVPRYRAADGAPWYHVLHGNVPDHQIDSMYCPEVPQGLLAPTHVSHLARLLKYIEPQAGATHAFAIGNLSRDDIQHEAGHGALGMIFGFRIGGATDDAGRANPPFAHGIIAVDRNLGVAPLLETASTFYRHVMDASESDSSPGIFYRDYVRAVRESPERVAEVLSAYVARFGDLPEPGRSALGWAWEANEAAQPKRVVLVHGDEEPSGAVAHAAARIAAMLYQSNIRWTAITNGREADVPGGVTVRLVAERNVSLEDRRGLLLRLEEVPQDEGEIARLLFGAKPRAEEAERPRYAGWRERYAPRETEDGGPVSGPSDDPRLGPQGTLVMNQERLFGAPAREPPADAAGAVARPEPRYPGAGAVEMPAAAGVEQEVIPVILENQRPARTWFWVTLGGAGCVVLVMAVAAATASMGTRAPESAPGTKKIEVVAQGRPVAVEPVASVEKSTAPERPLPGPAAARGAASGAASVATRSSRTTRPAAPRNKVRETPAPDPTSTTRVRLPEPERLNLK
jgi:hypothetical protein